MTPAEWRDLDPRDATFLANSFSELNRRKQAEMDRAESIANNRRR